jgi:hypothetical protein
MVMTYVDRTLSKAGSSFLVCCPSSDTIGHLISALMMSRVLDSF